MEDFEYVCRKKSSYFVLDEKRLNSSIVVFDSPADLPAAESMPLELDSMLLALCDKGEISATVDLIPRVLTASSIMVLRPGHTISDLKTSHDFDGFFIVVDRERLTDIMPTLARMIPCVLHYRNNPIISISREELESRRLIFSILSDKVNGPRRPYHKETVDALCEMIFYDTLGLYTAHMKRNSEFPSRREELFLRFLDRVDQHFTRQRSVQFYADLLGVTSKHLSTVVKEISGRTAGEWIDSEVITRAKLMLRNSGMTIQEISNELNFSNQSFFGKYFKNLTGLSPREYRSRLPLQ